MKSLSENIETYPDWLTDKQISILEHLKEAGPNGIDQHNFYVYATNEGVDTNEFSALIAKQFIKGVSGKNMHDKIYVHKDFVFEYNSDNSDHRSIMLNTANALSNFKGATRNPSGFMDHNWDAIRDKLPKEQHELAEKLKKVSTFRQYVTKILKEVYAEE